MAETEYVRVELISNPSVKRTMSKNSLRVNSNKWREVGAEQVEKKELPKNVVAEVAGENPTEPVKTQAQDVDPELAALRTEYEAKTGKPADKRMKADKLKAKLDEINGVA